MIRFSFYGHFSELINNGKERIVDDDAIQERRCTDLVKPRHQLTSCFKLIRFHLT